MQPWTTPVVHVDECTLRRGEAGRCELDEGPGIPVQTARRLACDASIVTITEDERGDPLDVGRKTRSIPPALRRALASRDKGCVFPGCTHTRYVDGPSGAKEVAIADAEGAGGQIARHRTSLPQALPRP